MNYIINKIYEDFDKLTNEKFFKAWIDYPFCSFYKPAYCIPVFGKTEEEVRNKVNKAVNDKSRIDYARRDMLRNNNYKNLDNYQYIFT